MINSRNTLGTGHMDRKAKAFGFALAVAAIAMLATGVAAQDMAREVAPPLDLHDPLHGASGEAAIPERRAVLPTRS